MRCCGRAASALLLVLLASPVHAAWHRLDSPNFVVVGDATARELRDMAMKFEAFRESLARFRGKAAAPAAVPTVILAFASDKAFTPFKPRYQGRVKDVGGLFIGGQNVNHIALMTTLAWPSAEADQFKSRVIYHEYAHLVISDELRGIPLWLNEGLAELYSTFEMTRDGSAILVGRSITQHLALLQSETPLKLADLLRVNHSSPLYNEGERRSVFYAQSWALAHMLILGNPSRAKQLESYLQRVSRGAESLEGWVETFGNEPIEADLQRYIRQASSNAVKLKLPEKLARFQGPARPLARREVDAFLAQFLIAQGRHEDAAKLLAVHATGGEQQSSVDVVSAQLSLARGKIQEATKAASVLRQPEDWLMSYFAGVLLTEALEGMPERRPDVAAVAAAFLEAATRERQIPNAVIRRASLELAAGPPPTDTTLLAVQAARSVAPGRTDYAFLHARLLAHRSEFAAARSVLGPVLAGAAAAHSREHARALLEWIVKLEKQHGARAEANGGQSGAPAPATEAPAAETMQRSEPVFRTLQEGEERVDGLLQRIECSRTRRAVTFVLQKGDETVRLSAPRMQNVEFVTYRDDVSGDVTCGPLKEPMRVYVTSRAGAGADGARRVVAVEFLPIDMQ